MFIFVLPTRPDKALSLKAHHGHKHTKHQVRAKDYIETIMGTERLLPNPLEVLPEKYSPDTPPSPAVQCVMIMASIYFFIYGLLVYVRCVNELYGVATGPCTHRGVLGDLRWGSRCSLSPALRRRVRDTEIEDGEESVCRFVFCICQHFLFDS